MLIRTGYEMIYDLPQPVAMQLMLHFHPSRQADVREETQRIETGDGQELPVDEYTDWYGNRCQRVIAPAGKLRLWANALVEDSGEAHSIEGEAAQASVEELPVEILPYLLSSRYCEVDKLSPVAWELFGATEEGLARVRAVCNWVNAQVVFGYHHARWTKSALDVFVERAGVCRDFTHLALTFCRCLNIPARYVTGYLGDIGVPRSPNPMDFSGWFEVYLDGRWWTFDARHNKPRIGRILMAVGRDAADVALTTSFGPAPLISFKVWTDEVK